MKRLLKHPVLIAFLLIFIPAHSYGAGEKPFRFNESIVVDGVKRSYTVNLPPNYYRSSSLPLVIALHGGGGSSAPAA